jgi:hypothetical protein
MAKNYLQVSDNVIEKHLLVRTKELGRSFYYASQELDQLTNEIFQFYADNFT